MSLPDDVFNSTDKFKTNNNFYGGQIGVSFDYWLNRFFIQLKGKAALGANCGSVKIRGSFRTNEFDTVMAEGPAQTIEGGIFALPSNIGRHNKTFFCALPEVDLNIGFFVLKCLKLQAGYTFIYASNVLWAASQMDRDLNYTQSAVLEYTPTPELVGKARPRPLHKSRCLWVQDCECRTSIFLLT